MDLIVTALGEFIWAASYVFKFRMIFLLNLFYFRCAVINFCISSGFSAVAVFVSFLCMILASAFYRYTTSREEMSLDETTCSFDNQDHNDPDESFTIIESSLTSTTPLTTTDELNNANTIQSLSEIEIDVEESTNENGTDNEQALDDLLIDTIEGSEEDIQKQQIANIYRLLSDQQLINNWSTTDFLDQLKMYGLETYEQDELQSA